MISGKGETKPFERKLRMGMVGGGRDSFIGAVHRQAATLDGSVELVAGALSSTPERSRRSAQEVYIPEQRAYGTWQEMLEHESALPMEQRLDFVSILTPNYLHYPIAKAFVAAGFHVILDKPMVLDSEEANDLARAVEKAGVVLAVTYNYTGYPLVKQARHLVQTGQVGEIRKVVLEYSQGWLRTKLEDTGHKQAVWRADPSRAGIGGAIGDIGSHAEHMVSTVTGLEIEELCADLTTFLPGRLLDDDANVLLHFTNGARGILTASQVCTRQENNLSIHRATHIPAGHPEGFVEAFANIYRNAADTIRARLMGVEPTELELDFPDVYAGARGVFFIEKVVESSKSGSKWTPARWKRG